MGSYLLEKFLLIPAILIAFTVKEYIRARVAYNLGDKSQKLQGRMTLDPFAHIDLMGFVLIIITGFGWSKPTQVNRYAFKKPKEDSIKVTLAAFSSYLLVAFLAYVIFFIVAGTAIGQNDIGFILLLLFKTIAGVNISLFVFNLIPMPGLEMHTLLTEFAPGKAFKILEFTSRNNMLILLGIVLAAQYVLVLPVGLVSSLISKFAYIIVGIFI